jgi:predicted Rossmann-fold nucleotide-binding protein
MIYKEIETQEALIDILDKNELLETIVFQNVDFKIVAEIAQKKEYNNCLFLGCKLPETWENIKTDKCLIFPTIDVPFNVYISTLYDSQKLYGDYILGKPETFALTLDQKIYRDYNYNNQYSRNIKITLAQRIHDHSITDALSDFLSKYDEKKIVGIMGGHQLMRSDREFLEIALLSKKLTENGYLMVSGGGPGAMEATHVGAWFGGKDDKVLEQACNILGEAPDFRNPLWLEKAMLVLSNHPVSEFESIGIPTWLYGHEPTTPFASKIAKYFENSIREEGLLTIAKGGIIFTPGSAGTLQEIFQETVQNHYLVYGYSSPMIFFGKKYWTDEIPVYPFFQLMIEKGKYKNLIVSIYDETEEILKELNRFSE